MLRFARANERRLSLISAAASEGRLGTVLDRPRKRNAVARRLFVSPLALVAAFALLWAMIKASPAKSSEPEVRNAPQNRGRLLQGHSHI